MRRQQESHYKYWDQVTLENAMQMANFKNFAFRRNELYSKVRPPVSKCHPEITAEYLMDAINNYGYRAVVNKLNRMRAETNENNSTDSGSSKLKTLHSLKSKPMQDNNNTPREIKRMLNSRPANFQQWEKPPSASMTPVLKGVSMVSIDENDTEKRSGLHMAQDDVVEVWRRCPNKDTLGYYGVDTGSNKPEAAVFNQVIDKCLKKVKQPETKAKPLKTPAASSVPATSRHQYPFVLNRSQLKAKVDNMASLKVTKAISWLNCRRSRAMAQPFFQSETQIGQKKVIKATQLRRRQKQQKSEFLNYECMEPKQVSAYELAYQREMEKLEQEIESEPKDYDELFSNLITCFQRSSQRDSVYDAFKRCKGSSQHNFVPDFSGTNESGGGGDTASGGAQTGFSTEGSTLRRALDAASERDEARRKLLKYSSPKPINTTKGATMRASRGASEGAEDAGSGSRAGRGGDVSSGSRGGRGKRLSKTSSSYRKSRARPDVTRASNKKPQMPQQGRFDDKFRKKEHSFIISSSTSRSIITNYYGDNSKDDKSSAKTRTVKNKKNNSKAKKEWNPHLSRCPKTLRGRDCNCEVCNFMERRDREPDSPLISKMKEEEKRRKLREYYKSMRYKEQMASAPQEYRPLYNQHKCEPIREENCFCTSRKWGECLDRLDALQELQKSYGHMDKDLLHKVKVLKDRLCWQICEGLQLQRKLGAVRY